MNFVMERLRGVFSGRPVQTWAGLLLCLVAGDLVAYLRGKQGRVAEPAAHFQGVRHRGVESGCGGLWIRRLRRIACENRHHPDRSHNSGKSTQRKLLAENLGLPQCSLDDYRWGYYKEIGYDEDFAKKLSEKVGFWALYMYSKELTRGRSGNRPPTLSSS